MNRLIYGVIGSAVLLAGCSKEQSDVQSGERVEIIPQVTLAGSVEAEHNPQSKATVDANTTLDLYFARADAPTGSYGTYNASAFKLTRTSGTSASAFDPAQYYLPAGKMTKMTGWYPQATSFTGGVVSWTIDGSQDVMTATKQEGSSSTAMPSFTFKHQLTQLNFFVYLSAAEVKDVWGQVTAITVTAQRNTCSYTLTDDAAPKLVFSDPATQALTVAASASVQPSVGQTNAVQFGDPIMIEPQTAAAYTLKITITTENGGTVAATVPARAYAVGEATRVELRFTATEITPQASITPWVNDDDAYASGDGEIDPLLKPYVRIGNLEWATGNLVANGTNGCKIGAPTDGGLYFQFGSLIGWNGGANGDGTGQGINGADIASIRVKPLGYADGTTWDGRAYTGGGTEENVNYCLPGADNAATGIGDPCRYYLGGKWHTPTTKEYTTLFPTYISDFIWQTSPSGARNVVEPRLFFPTAGVRNAMLLNYVNRVAATWSSSITIEFQSGDIYGILNLTEVNMEPSNGMPRDAGFPIRCVRDVETEVTEVTPSYVEVNGLKWATGNLVADGPHGCKIGAPTDGGLYFQFGSLIGWKGGAVENGGTGRGTNPYTEESKQSWGGGPSWSWDNDAMVWPTVMASKPTVCPSNVAVGAESQAFKKWYFDFSGIADGTNYAASGSDIRPYLHPEFGALKDGCLAGLGVGDPCTYYLGDPWRLPTTAEFRALFGFVTAVNWNVAPDWTWQAAAPQGATRTKEPKLFFPASGYRMNGLFKYVNANGKYWSSEVGNTASSPVANLLDFDSSNPRPTFMGRALGLPIRCVRD